MSETRGTMDETDCEVEEKQIRVASSSNFPSNVEQVMSSSITQLNDRKESKVNPILIGPDDPSASPGVSQVYDIDVTVLVRRSLSSTSSLAGYPELEKDSQILDENKNSIGNLSAVSDSILESLTELPKVVRNKPRLVNLDVVDSPGDPELFEDHIADLTERNLRSPFFTSISKVQNALSLFCSFLASGMKNPTPTQDKPTLPVVEESECNSKNALVQDWLEESSEQPNQEIAEPLEPVALTETREDLPEPFDSISVEREASVHEVDTIPTEDDFSRNDEHLIEEKELPSPKLEISIPRIKSSSKNVPERHRVVKKIFSINAFRNVRNACAEETRQLAPLAPCRYAISGCEEMVDPGSISEKCHSRNCNYRPIECIVDGCEEEIPFHSFLIHLQKHFIYPNYGLQLTTSIVIQANDFLQSGIWGPKWLSFEGTHFFFMLFRTNGHWASWVWVFGENEANYKAQITLFKGTRCIFGTYPVHSLRQSKEEIMNLNKGCLVTSDKTVKAVTRIGQKVITDLGLNVSITPSDGTVPSEDDGDCDCGEYASESNSAVTLADKGDENLSMMFMSSVKVKFSSFIDSLSANILKFMPTRK